MKFETSTPPNFIRIKGTDTVVDIGMLSDHEFEIFKFDMSVELTKHYIKRRAHYDKEANLHLTTAKTQNATVGTSGV
jgi:hypothetical protein